MQSNTSVVVKDRKPRSEYLQSSYSSQLGENSTKGQSLHKINQWEFPVFKSLRQEELEILDKNSVIQQFKKKSYIYMAPEGSQNIYFIKKGNIEIGYLDEEGRELTHDILGSGDLFGPALGLGFSNGYARTLDNTVLAVIQKNVFEHFLEKYPLLSYKLIKILSVKINALENKLQNFVFKDVKARIAQQLLMLFKKSGNEKNGFINIPLTHQDVAKLVGSTRETASVYLAELKSDGVISYNRQKIQILSPENLMRYVN